MALAQSVWRGTPAHSQDKLAARVVALEARLAAVEARVAALESSASVTVAPAEPAPAMTSASPVTTPSSGRRLVDARGMDSSRPGQFTATSDRFSICWEITDVSEGARVDVDLKEAETTIASFTVRTADTNCQLVTVQVGGTYAILIFVLSGTTRWHVTVDPA